MGNTRKTFRTVVLMLAGAALVAGLAACTPAAPEPSAGAADTVSAAPTAPATSGSTATPDPATSDPDATAAWAAEAVPTGGADGFIMAQSGRFQDDAPGSFSLTAASLPAGDYSVYLACRGDADTTITLTVDNALDSAMASGCSDVSQGMTFSTTDEGAVFTLLGDRAEAVEWALAVTELLPGAEG
jgi:hypothetical protein